MPFLSADRVKETTVTTGTGTYSLAGAVTCFRTFVAGIGSTNQCAYTVEDGTNWEVGIGTVTDATPDTLSRDEILASSNAGAAVNWGAGTKNVFCSPVAALQPQTRKLTADLSAVTVTTLGDATGLSFPVVSGRYYRYKFLYLFRTAVTTTGIKVSVTIPAFTRFGGTVTAPTSTGDAQNTMFFGFITSSDDPVIGTGVQSATLDYITEIEGILVPSANGTLQGRYASEIAASGVTLRQGSMAFLERIL